MILTLTVVNAGSGQAQTSASKLEGFIAEDHRLIQQAEQQHLSDDRIGYLWALLASNYRKAGDFAASENAYAKALHLFEQNPSSARNYATTLDNLAMLYLVYGRLDEAEKYNRKGAKIRSGLGYPLDEARSEQHMAEIDLARHKFKAAEKEAASALEVMTRLDDPEKLDIVSALNALTFTRCLRKACEEGMEAAQRSLSMARSSFGEESRAVAHALMAAGFAEWKLGRLDDADRTMRTGIQMMKAQEGPESRAALLALMEYRNYLEGVHRDREAERIRQEISVAMSRQAPACATCVSVFSLANALK